VERVIATLPTNSGRGLVVIPSVFMSGHRDLIVAAAARHAVPASCAAPVFPLTHDLGRPTFFDVVRRFTALRLRALASLPLALERRRIAHPKAQDYADFQRGITAEICDWRNGVRGVSCTAQILNRLMSAFGSILLKESSASSRKKWRISESERLR
jgi:hypothetical protein